MERMRLYSTGKKSIWTECLHTHVSYPFLINTEMKQTGTSSKKFAQSVKIVYPFCTSRCNSKFLSPFVVIVTTITAECCKKGSKRTMFMSHNATFFY